MTVVLPTGVCAGGGAGGAAAVAVLSRGCAGRSRGYRHRRGADRGGGGPGGMTPAVVRAWGRHGIHRADAGARGDLAVAGVRQTVCLTGRQQGVTWGRGGRHSVSCIQYMTHNTDVFNLQSLFIPCVHYSFIISQSKGRITKCQFLPTTAPNLHHTTLWVLTQTMGQARVLLRRVELVFWAPI